MLYYSLCTQNFRGKVVNPEGEAIEGVTVTAQLSGKRAITNIKGNFAVTTVLPVTLVFIHVAYQPLRVVVNDPFSITVFRLARAPTAMSAVTAVGTVRQKLSRELIICRFSGSCTKLPNKRIPSGVINS